MVLTDAQKEQTSIRFLIYLNNNDFFWSNDMRRTLNLVYSNVSINPYHRHIVYLIKKLKKKSIIGVSDRKGPHYQYYKKVDRIIVFNDLN